MKKFRKSYSGKSISLNTDMQFWFCTATLLGILLTTGGLFVSHGKLFSEIFFFDQLDTGMDFFHSIEYTRGRSPYDLFHTLYPPLANMFFYILFRFVPYEQSSQWEDTFADSVMARGTYSDLRLWQATMVLFICFIFLSAIGIVFMVQAILGYSLKSAVVGLCVVLSYGVLYSFERGNIIIVAALCCMFFVAFRDSPNRILREGALVMLAIGAGLKIYPALFGVLLIYDKQYAKAVRAIIYGILFFVAPVFLFHEGIEGITKFFGILFAFAEESHVSSDGYSFDKIVNTMILLLMKLFDLDINQFSWIKVLSVMNIPASVLMLGRGFFVNKNWQRVLACSLAILFYQAQSIYMLVFLIIPFLFMLKEEKNICRNNLPVYSALILSQVLLPIWEPDNSIISIVFLRFQLCMLILGGALFCKKLNL